MFALIVRLPYPRTTLREPKLKGLIRRYIDRYPRGYSLKQMMRHVPSYIMTDL